MRNRGRSRRGEVGEERLGRRKAPKGKFWGKLIVPSLSLPRLFLAVLLEWNTALPNQQTSLKDSSR